MAIKSQPQLLHDLRWGPAVLILVAGVPLTLIANAFEFILIGASANHRIPFMKAFEISIIASAANMLPLPGGAITRVAWLKNAGVDIKRSAIITFLYALLWLGISFFLSGICIVSTGNDLIAGTFIFFGICVVVSCVYTMIKYNVKHAIIWGAIFQRTAITAIEAFRIWLCFKAIGADISFIQAGIFLISGVLGSAVSIVPAGLGIREGVSALLAPIAGIHAGTGFLAAAANRIFALFLLAPLAIIMGLKKRPKAHQLLGIKGANDEQA